MWVQVYSYVPAVVFPICKFIKGMNVVKLQIAKRKLNKTLMPVDPQAISLLIVTHCFGIRMACEISFLFKYWVFVWSYSQVSQGKLHQPRFPCRQQPNAF